jgi:hypothetical protein
VKLLPAGRRAVARAIGHHAEFYPDWTDLLCIPFVLVAFAIGRDELRRVPLGRRRHCTTRPRRCLPSPMSAGLGADTRLQPRSTRGTSPRSTPLAA